MVLVSILDGIWGQETTARGFQTWKSVFESVPPWRGFPGGGLLSLKGIVMISGDVLNKALLKGWHGICPKNPTTVSRGRPPSAELAAAAADGSTPPNPSS